MQIKKNRKERESLKKDRALINHAQNFISTNLILKTVRKRAIMSGISSRPFSKMRGISIGNVTRFAFRITKSFIY